uniref:Uncharacterized protein n=1 Tax=Setaria viridis TaxID=4556 RepID=A0A4U6WBE1_SETVI|nr:hypothetical protein SEVIR_1G150766v2 [Setaria viridis]
MGHRGIFSPVSLFYLLVVPGPDVKEVAPWARRGGGCALGRTWRRLCLGPDVEDVVRVFSRR